MFQTLYQLFADLKTPQEAEAILKDILSDVELTTVAKRLAVAYWLANGRSYNNIKDNLKVSSATIATIQTMMNKPGFKLALKKAEAEEWANQWAEKIKKIVKK